MNDINVEKLKWKYHAEGNANIIIRNVDLNLVLRLRKITLKNSFPTKSCKKVEKIISLEDEFVFTDEIISCILKENVRYLNTTVLVNLSEDFVKSTVNDIEKCRPKKRTHKQVELKKQAALLMPFLGCFTNEPGIDIAFDCFTVELKPKWGFLPFSQNLGEANIKRSICRFCLHQDFKLEKGSVAQKSDYCPLDLYGDCSCKIKCALNSLFITPQNNLGVLINGKKVEVDSLELASLYERDTFINIITGIIIDDSKRSLLLLGNSEPPTLSCARSRFRQHKQDCVTMNGRMNVFNLLSKLQQYDDIDIEFLGPVYKEIIRDSVYDESDFLDFRSKLWTDFIHTLHSTKFRGDSNKKLEYFDLCRYLISATFKDCSVIVTFCEVAETTNAMTSLSKKVVSVEGRCFVYDIKIIDLDPRLVQNIPFYYKLDQDILHCQRNGEK